MKLSDNIERLFSRVKDKCYENPVFIEGDAHAGLIGVDVAREYMDAEYGNFDYGPSGTQPGTLLTFEGHSKPKSMMSVYHDMLISDMIENAERMMKEQEKWMENIFESVTINHDSTYVNVLESMKASLEHGKEKKQDCLEVPTVKVNISLRKKKPY